MVTSSATHLAGSTERRQRSRLAIVGGGPAGLTAAYEGLKRGWQPTVYEAGERVGGISRTECHGGYRFDIGGHRFYTREERVQDLWDEVMGDSMLTVSRLSRILYKRKFFRYPLELFDALSKLGIVESARIMASYARWRAFPYRREDTFEEWITNRFGKRLYKVFFKTYTEKVWGMPCSEISADWAAQRIKGLNLPSAVLAAITGKSKAKSLIRSFRYPPRGPGMMWECFADRIAERGGEVQLGTRVTQIHHDDFRVRAIDVKGSDGVLHTERPSQVISSMPLCHLIRSLVPKPPAEVMDAAAGLRYRDFLIVAIFVNQEHLFPDNWIYIHSENVRVGRIQNFKNWSEGMVPDESTTSLGMEYFCNVGEDLWRTSDEDLIALARSEAAELGLLKSEDVTGGTVIRQPKVYPVYDEHYRQNVEILHAYLDRFSNLQTVGRNGLHRYNNQDHSMLTAMLAVENLEWKRHDLWAVNGEPVYGEERPTKQPTPAFKPATVN